MIIRRADAHTVAIPLSRPYTIAFRTVSAVQIVVVQIEDDEGHIGFGAASPEPQVTGETNEACQAALDNLGWLRGRDPRTRATLCRELQGGQRLTPAARAAVDMALHDLFAQILELPLCDVLGRVRKALPTSITIGIKPTEATLDEAAEYIGRGFRILKVKVGKGFDEDIERLRRLRERVGRAVILRVDANQGYTVAETERFFADTARLDLEFLEQPVPAAGTMALRDLPEDLRSRIAIDEPLQSRSDALSFATPPWPGGIFNIKLMKSGGISPALQIADIADTAGIGLMWGCMDESCISIAAALHAALATPATRYLDLDGSFDLARDPAVGGFVVEPGGLMRPTGGPGLDVKMANP